MEFSSLDLVQDLQKAITEMGFVTATPVQEAVFPHGLAGEDIYAQSQTGTGKTAAFLIPILNRIMTVPELKTRKVLILAPTRELAVQIEAETAKLAKFVPISSACFYGGVGYGPQVDALRDNVQMIIGTPGRIIDLVKQGKMLLKEVGFLVIDEADRMFDMGFVDDLRKLIRYLPGPKERQTFLFSATLGLRVKDLAWEYMDVPKEIVIEPEHMTVDLVTQELHHVGAHEKMRLLLGILRRDKPGSAIIFANQKYMVEEISRRLRINGIENEYIMGDLPQSKRLEIIDSLKAGRLSILVATDVAARGLDVEALDLVINYDVPDDTESYVHRIGRTARAGKSGKAITLACEKFVFNLPSIEKFIGMKIPVAGWDPALQVEDRSEGMRFGRSARDGHGYSRDGGSRDSGRRDGRGGPGGRPEGRRDGPGSRHREELPRDSRGPRREDSFRGSPAPRAPQHGEGYRGGRSPLPAGAEASEHGEQVDPKLAGLSQEERMKVWKEKYGGQGGPQGGGRGPGNAPDGGRRGGGSRSEGDRPNPRKEPRRPEGRGPAAPQAPRRAYHEPHSQSDRPSGASARQPTASLARPPAQTVAPIPPAAPAPTKKPGLLDRIKGLFSGKRQD